MQNKKSTERESGAQREDEKRKEIMGNTVCALRRSYYTLANSTYCISFATSAFNKAIFFSSSCTLIPNSLSVSCHGSRESVNHNYSNTNGVILNTWSSE